VVPASVQQGPVRSALTEAKGLALAFPTFSSKRAGFAATHHRRLAGGAAPPGAARLSGSSGRSWSGDPTTGTSNWRRSARDDPFLRARKEWEARPHRSGSGWRLSPSDGFPVAPGDVSKRDAGMVFCWRSANSSPPPGSASASFGESDLMLARNAAERIAQFLPAAKPSEPETRALRRSATSC